MHRSHFIIFWLAGAFTLFAQQPEPRNNPPRLERNPAAALPTPAPRNVPVNIEFNGATRFRPEQLRAAISDPLNDISQQGLTPAAADDVAFFTGIFYRKNGYSQVNVKWRITGDRSIVLDINEGPFTTLGDV